MQNRDWRRPFRYLWRLPLLFAAHPRLATPCAAQPVGRALRWRGGRVTNGCCHLVAADDPCFGMRIRRVGVPRRRGDVRLQPRQLDRHRADAHQRALGFVAKSEIKRGRDRLLASRGATSTTTAANNESLHA